MVICLSEWKCLLDSNLVPGDKVRLQSLHQIQNLWFNEIYCIMWKRYCPANKTLYYGSCLFHIYCTSLINLEHAHTVKQHKTDILEHLVTCHTHCLSRSLSLCHWKRSVKERKWVFILQVGLWSLRFNHEGRKWNKWVKSRSEISGQEWKEATERDF